MPVAKSFGGNATSPAIIDQQVILYRGTYVDHFLLAVDKSTGKENWKIPQHEPFTGESAKIGNGPTPALNLDTKFALRSGRGRLCKSR